MDDLAYQVIFMVLLKLLVFKWSRCDLTHHFKSAIHCCDEKLSGTKIHPNICGSDDKKNNVLFLFLRCVEEYIFAELVLLLLLLWAHKVLIAVCSWYI